jgi:hypothetical protein
MHEHHITSVAQNQPYSPNNGFNDNNYAYGGFGYSPFADCPVVDIDAIIQDFNCGLPRKARVR